MRCQGLSEKTTHDVFAPNDMDDLCELVKKSIKPHGRGHVFHSALKIYTWWRTIHSSTEGKEVVSGGEGKRVEIKQRKMFQVWRVSLFYNEALGQ